MPPCHLQILGGGWKQDQVTDMAFISWWRVFWGQWPMTAGPSKSSISKQNQFFSATFFLSTLVFQTSPHLFQDYESWVIKLTLPPPSARGLCCMYTPCSFFRFALNDLTVDRNQTQSHILLQLRLEVYIQHASVSFVGIFFLKSCQLHLVWFFSNAAWQ